MKFLIIAPSFYPATYYGGPTNSLYNSAQCLAKNSIQVFVSTTNCNGKKKLDVEVNKYLELDKNLSVKYYSGGTESGFSIRMFLTLLKDIKGKDCIYLVSIFSPPAPLVIFLNIFFKKPLILSARGQLGDWCLKQGNIFKKLWLKVFISPVANKITWEATSGSEKEMIKKVYPKAKVEVVQPVVELENYLISKEKNYSIYKRLTGKNFDGKRIIVSMGRLHKVKGFDILIKAMHISQRADLVLLIAGEDFGERKNIEMLIGKLGLREKVYLVGMIEGKDKTEFLCNADVFALASHHENFGTVYAEALASGIPVIASRNTPWEEVEKYNCGKWVNNIPEDFSKAIAEVLNSDTKIIGMNGRKFVSERFSCDEVIKKYKLMFETILEQI